MNNISVVLIRPQNSGNLGAIARTMANFGFSNLVLVEPECKIDVEARNRAKHAQAVLDNARFLENFAAVRLEFDILAATTGISCTDYNIARSPILAFDAAKELCKKKGKIALVFGPEDFGLLNEEMLECDLTITIPSDKKYSVLNLSHAVAIVLYELSKEKNSCPIKETHKQASTREKEETLKIISSLIGSVKWRTSAEKKTQEMVWKRIIGKGMLTKRETYSIMGFLKKLKK